MTRTRTSHAPLLGLTALPAPGLGVLGLDGLALKARQRLIWGGVAG